MNEATLDKVVEIHREAGTTCGQLFQFVKGIERMLENDPTMPKEERAELSGLVAVDRQLYEKMGCPPPAP